MLYNFLRCNLPTRLLVSLMPMRDFSMPRLEIMDIRMVTTGEEEEEVTVVIVLDSAALTNRDLALETEDLVEEAIKEADEVVEEGVAVTEVDEAAEDVAVASPLLATTTRAIGGNLSSKKFETKFYVS